MTPIRILLVDLPEPLRDLVGRVLDREEDMVVVDGRAGADVLVVSAPEAEHRRLCAELLERDPRARVLVIDPESGQASSCRLEPRHDPLGVLPLARLSDALRLAVRPTRGR